MVELTTIVLWRLTDVQSQRYYWYSQMGTLQGWSSHFHPQQPERRNPSQVHKMNHTKQLNNDIYTLTWCRKVFLKQNTRIDSQLADDCLHVIMNYQPHTPEF